MVSALPISSSMSQYDRHEVNPRKKKRSNKKKTVNEERDSEDGLHLIGQKKMEIDSGNHLVTR